MAKHSRYLPLILTFTVIAVIVGAMLKGKESAGVTIENKPMPDFTLALLDAKRRADQRVFQGQLSLLNVWASWCAVCQVEHQFLMQLATDPERLHGVNLVGLNYRDNRAAAQQVLVQEGNPYRTVLYDPNGLLALDLGVYGTPESYLVDTEGVIRHRHMGALTPKVWQKEFVPLITSLRQASY